MFAFMRRIKANRLRNLESSGYEYAAGRLLHYGKAAVKDLEEDVEIARTFGDYDEFDKGIERAIEDFKIYI